MTIPSLQTFILGENQTITLGDAHRQLREYFGRENIWNDPLESSEGFGGARRIMCYRHAAGDNEWGRKFSVLERPTPSLDQHMGMMMGGAGILLAIGCFIASCAIGQWTPFYIVGGFGLIGLLVFIRSTHSFLKSRREIREIRSENLNVEKVTDLVNQIISVLTNRNVVSELRNRVQNGQQQN